MINEDMAKEINSALEKDFPNTGKLGMKPVSSINGGRMTVTADIEALKVKLTADTEALKAKLDGLIKGINLLKDQL